MATATLKPGDEVRVRRWVTCGKNREPHSDYTGTVGLVDRYGIRLDPEPGYIGLGYVFLGMDDGHQGESVNLVTEVEVIKTGTEGEGP